MSVSNPPVWSDPSTAAVDIPNGSTWTQAAVDAIASDLMYLGGGDGNSGAAGKVQLLTDGGFEVWDRGVGPTSAGGAGVYVASIWSAIVSQASGGPCTMTVARDAGANGSAYAAKLVWTRAGATNPSGILQQKLEDYLELKGKTVSFSMDVNSTVTGVYLAIGDLTTNTQTSATSTTLNAYQRLSVSAVVPSTGSLCVRVYMPTTADAVVYLDNGMLVLGAGALGYLPLHPNDENSRCKRYIQTTRVSMRNDAANAGQTTDMPVYYQDMFAAPTVTITAGTRNNIGTPTANDVQSNNLRYEMVATAGANTATYVQRDVLTLEADP